MYSHEEIIEIFKKSNQQKENVKFMKFEKLGIHSPVNLINSNIHYTCEICKKNLLSNHLLDLHVAENHDTFFELQSSKKSMFQCYIEACQFMSKDSTERKDHCIKDHKFPHDFPFEISNAKKPEKKASPTAKHKNFHFGHKSQKSFKSSGSTKIDMKDLMDVLPDP